MNSSAKHLLLVLVSFVALTSSIPLCAQVSQSPTTAPLLQQSNFQYVGSFRLPNGATDSTSFSYGGTGLAYYPANNSLFLTGHSQHQYTAEVSIPTPINSGQLSGLNTAMVVQQLTDALDGHIGAISPTDTAGKVIGGYLVYGGRLIVSGRVYYDASGLQSSSHFVRPVTLPAGAVAGPFRVGSQYPGFVDGYMGLVPPEWQQLLGGPALTGGCCFNIISFQSNGPSVSVFDPAQLDGTSTVTATELVGYPHSSPLGTGWGTQSDLFNGTTAVTGVVFPVGSRSVLFFGRQGTGPFCYGPGTSNAALAGTPSDSNGDRWCYDPTAAAKGGHAYPYVYQVWAYDADDLLKVKDGTEVPSAVQPYAIWHLSLPFVTQSTFPAIAGAAYDPETNRVYVDQQCVDVGCTPVIDVFQITGIGSGQPSANNPPAQPEPPTGVIVH